MIWIFISSGIVSALPFIFPYLWILNWVSISPVIYLLVKNSHKIKYRKLYLYGLGFGLGYFGVMYHWFSYMHPMEFAGLDNFQSAVVIFVCWFGLALIQSLEFGFVPVLFRLGSFKNSAWQRGMLFAVVWTLYEFQQTLFWRGVPWGRLSISQYKVPFNIQSASLLGSVFVSALIVAVNALIALAVYYSVEVYKNNTFKGVIISFWKNKRVRTFAFIAAAAFSLNAIFGVLRMTFYDEKSGDMLTAAVIQGNISSTDKWAEDSAFHSVNLYVELTVQCVEESGADIVVWPETVIPLYLRESSFGKNKISQAASQTGATILVGTFDRVYDEDADDFLEYNAILIFYPDGTIGQTSYYKRRPVPFGETLPMADFIELFLPMLLDLNLFSEPISAGADSNLFETEYGKVGSLICFDSIYETLTLDSVRDGARVISLSTNDSWFHDSAAVWQHNAHASMRAIESGRYIIRAANTGVSSVITPEGKVLSQIQPLVKGYAYADIYARDDRTLYSYVGNIFVYACILCYIGFAAVNLKGKIRAGKE